MMCERDGEFVRDNTGALDLTGVTLRVQRLQDHNGATPVVPLRSAVLDALDAEGRITFYRAGDGQGFLLRRRVLRDGVRSDEVFGRVLR